MRRRRWLHTILLPQRRSEARWQTVLDSAQGAIKIDQRGTLTLFNRAAERIVGYAANEVVGRDVPD